MLLRIPQELQKYVRMSKKDGLIRSDNMPDELKPLFEETRKSIISAEQERRNGLLKLVSGK